MASFIDVEMEFPTAEKTRETATKRKFINRDNLLRRIFEQSIDPAVREGRESCEINRWDMNDEIIEFLVGKGYEVVGMDDPETNNLTIKWGINE